MGELLDQINTDTNKEAISVKEITKALESGFFDTQENIAIMIQELDHIDNNLERSCVQSLLKVAYTQPLYEKLQQYPELTQRLQVWSQEQYLSNLSLDEKKIGGLSLISLPKNPEDVTITTLSKYINTANILPEHHDMLVKVLQEQIKLLNQLCPDKKSLLDMTWNSKKNGLDAPVLKIMTLQQLSDRIKKEAQVRKEYEAIKETSIKQIDPSQLSKDVLKLWTITKLSELPIELGKLDTKSAFAQFLQKNQNDAFYGPILQQYVGIRLQPYIRKEGSVEFVSATINKENPELKNYVVGTTFGKKYIGETTSAYKNYKEQQQNLAKFHLTGATAEQITIFQRKRNNHQARIKPEYLKKIQEQEDQFNNESVLRHSQSTRDSMPYIKKGSVDKYIYDSVLTLTKDYVTLLLQTPEGKKLLKEKKYIDNPFMPGMRLNFAKGDVESIVRDSFFEKFGDGIDDFKKAWEEGRREEVGRSIGSLVGGTVAAGATTILTGGSGIWVAGAAFTIGSRTGGSLGGMVGAGFEGKSWSEVGNAGLVGLGIGERDQNGKFVNYFQDAKGNVTQDSLLHGAGRMGISLGTDYLSSVATFGIGNKIGLDKWAGKFVGAGWKQFASQGVVFGAEELFIENFFVDVPANTLQAGVSSFFLGNAIQDVGPRSAKLSQNTNTNKQIDPNNLTATQWDIKAALGAMATTFSQNISPENLGQTFAATLAYGGMLSGGRSAINTVAVALPALSVKNINEISTSYQSHLSDLQTKFPTLQIGKDMKSLTLDGKVLDQTHPRFSELEGSIKALQVLGKSFTDEMDKISQIQQGLTDPQSSEAKKRGLIYGWKLLHPRMTPLEVMDGRITKLKKEITTEKNATTKSQKEALLQQMEGVKGEIEGKTKGNVEGNNNIEYNSIYDADKYQYIYNGELMWPDMKDKDILMSIKDQKDKLFTEYRKKEDALWKQYSNNIEQYTNLRNPIHEQYLKELSELNAKVYAMSGLPLDFQNPVGRGSYGQVFRFLNDPSKLIKIGIISEYESIRDIQKIINVGKKLNNPRLGLPIEVIDLGKGYYAQIMHDVSGEHISKEIADLSDEEAALQLYQDAKALKKEGILLDRKNSTNFIKTSKGYSIIDVNTIPDNIRNKGDYYYLKKTNQPDVPLIDLVSKHTGIDLKSYIKDTSSNLLAAGIDSPNQIDLQPLLTIHPDLLKNIVNPEILQNILQSEISLGNLILNTDGSIKEVFVEVNGEKKPSQLFAKMKVDGFSEQQALKTWLQVRTPEFKNRFGDWQKSRIYLDIQSELHEIEKLYSSIDGTRGNLDFIDEIKNHTNMEVGPRLEVYKRFLALLKDFKNIGSLNDTNVDETLKELYNLNSWTMTETKLQEITANMTVIIENNKNINKNDIDVRKSILNKDKEALILKKTSIESINKTCSKVVDQNGEPLVVYHSSKSEFNYFDQKFLGSNTGKSFADSFLGYMFSDKINIDEQWNTINREDGLNFGDNLYPSFLNIALPYCGSELEKKSDRKSYGRETLDKYQEKIDKHKYDGFIETIGNARVYITTPATKNYNTVKSAINNDGSFSPETAKFNDYFGKESRFGFDSKQARDHSAFMDQFSGQATPEQIAQIRQKIESVAQMYADKTGKKLELTDAQIQAIIDTHLLPGQLGQLTQAELIAKNRKLTETIPDGNMRRFLLEAGFCGGNKIPQALIDNRNKVLEGLNKITINKQKFNEMGEKPNNIKDILKTLDEKEIHLKSQLNVFDKKIEYFERLFLLNTVLKGKGINGLFDYVDSITTNNGYKYLLDFLRKYGPDNLKNLNIDIVPLKDRKTNTGKEFGGRYFSPNNENLLELNPDFFSDTNNNDKAIYIVMHELGHVVTSNIIKAMHNYNPLFQIKELGLNSADIMKDKKNYEKVLNFLSLHPLHKSTFERLGLLKTELLGKHWNDEKGLLPISIMEYSDKSSNHYDFTKFYAFSNTAELISESLANPVIQKTLSEVPYQRKTSSIEADKFLSLLGYNNKNTFLHEYVSNIMNYCKEQNIRSL